MTSIHPDRPAGAAFPPIGRIVAAVPDFTIAGAFLLTWISPSFMGGKSLEAMMLTVFLEFIALHSAAFFVFVVGDGSFWKARLPRVLLLGAFYSVFVGAISYAKGLWWPIVGFWLLMFNRLWMVRPGVSGAAEAAFMSRYFTSLLLYFGLLLPTALIPLPAMGLTPDVVKAQGFDVNSTGVWVDRPSSLACFGLLYFLFLGIGELKGSHDDLHHGR